MPTTTTPLPDHVRPSSPSRATPRSHDRRDGAPRQAVVWYLLDGDTIVINSLEGRLWPTNLRRDPRVSIAITAADREEWVGLTGAVEIVDDQDRAQADIAAMAHRYHTPQPAAAEDLIKSRFQPQRRVSFRITPTSIHDHLEETDDAVWCPALVAADDVAGVP
jgi:PPOX class probable F420-dependent enzyme